MSNKFEKNPIRS